ncbi:TIGR02206 family membrane protein [Sabulilitoribacter arenilitoris]|uniref:TIGR02206 family membrane protein n=1 Tax=Wocania arenilitoris TaxID=2044858 RepID=A0AAE3JQJ8_9FLAO|nr:TIGR02206 family membrane protein [Wocania arenilitoris]MCF7569260.1 TIGR02206 family membrane protein [Wocania arenilitoris]
MNSSIFSAIFLLKRVLIGSIEHIFPIIISILFCVLFIKYSKLKFSSKQQYKALHALGCLVSLTVIAFHLYKISLEGYNITTDLPLYLCSLMALFIPVFTKYRKYWMFEILVFWILGGTVQGVVTPDIAVGFPSFDYFRFWAVHLGVLIIIFYAIFVFKMSPKLASVFKSYFALQAYVFLMILINYVLNANYFYLLEKPKSASLLDYFGDWPYYIIVVQIILIPYFLLIYLPFYWIEKRKKRIEEKTI